MELERKVYNSWAFKDNEKEKNKINYEIYQEFESKFKILKVGPDAIERRNEPLAKPTQEDLNNNDFVYSRRACYGRSQYKLYKVPEGLSDDEIALILDEGNLCFGYSKNSNDMFTVWED